MSALTKEAIRYDDEYKRRRLRQSPNKKVIKKKKKNRIVIDNFKNTFIIAIAFLFGLSIIYNYAVITDKKMEISILSEDIVKLNNEVDSYNITLESIKNTNKIEEMAKNYLGMSYPTRKQTVFVDFSYQNSEDDNQVVAQDKSEQLFSVIDKIVDFIQ